MTAQELIKFLKQVPPDAKVGRIGHFGEFHDISSYSIRKAYLNNTQEIVVAIEPPDIGPEPD
jgi:hypothetical protein